MSKILIPATLVVALAFGVGIALKAADQQAPVKTATSWLDNLQDAENLTVVDKQIVLSKKFDIGGDQRGFYVNVMQDCWTTDIEEVDIDPELENYILNPDNIVFVWKHKIFEGCENYIATIVGLPCEDGKPPIIGRIAWIVPNIEFGYIQPGAEYLIWVSVTGMPEGTWDWFVVSECNDTNGAITPPLKDGDIDDVIGANLGLVTYMPLVYGPEPIEVLDPDPGGFPPGRLPGEEGSCRCWCFTVEAVPECPSVVGTWDLYYDWDCDGTYGTTWMEFFSDGTWENGEGYVGTWLQDGCNIDWWFESGTHYWGVMELDGMYMEGDMLSYGGLEGCWWADRTAGRTSNPRGDDSFRSSGDPPEAGK